jgi:hypothetical protein
VALGNATSKSGRSCERDGIRTIKKAHLKASDGFHAADVDDANGSLFASHSQQRRACT